MKTKRILSLMLAAAMMLTMVMAGCGNNDTPASSTPVSSTVDSSAPSSSAVDSSSEVASEPAEDEVVTMPENYDIYCTDLFDAQFGDFYTAYQAAKAETVNVSKRFALMAIAEAKLLETGTLIPTTNNGSRPQISRLVPYTVDYVNYGSDQSRYHSGLVTTEPIKTADWDAMKAKWAELKGTGTYMEWAKGYLAEKGYELKDTFGMAYTGEPETFDILNSSRATVGEVICNTYDSLVEYDNEGVLQPALAESYEMSEDGLTYTFKIRQGVKWVDSQGREVADVKADDFVASMQHLCDCKAGLQSLLFGVIAGVEEYCSGDNTDFSAVGVKAVDDYTLQYTLANRTPYFTTMLGYSIFAPMSRSYYESLGGTFGEEFEESGAGDYGTSAETIAYCGPYLITNRTEKSKIVFSANESYWNPDNVNIKTITWTFNDGSDTTRYYTDLKNSVTDSNSLNTANLATAKEDGWWEQYGHVSGVGSTAYMAFLNVNRNLFHNARSSDEAVSPQTPEEAERTATAMKNAHFRMAVAMGLDRTSWNAQKQGDEFATYNLINSYVPGDFAVLTEEVSVDINGAATTFAAGTKYGAIMQAQLDADGVKIKVWDPAGNNGLGASDGFDGWYNAENAKAELAAAIEELAAEGLTIDENSPIQIDLPYPANMETYTNSAQVFKQSVEASLEGKVIVNLVACEDADVWYYTGYYTDYGYESNYDVFDLSGWAPDYGDPASYLDTFLPNGDGYMLKCVGLW